MREEKGREREQDFEQEHEKEQEREREHELEHENKARLILALVAVALIIVIVLAAAGSRLIKRYSYSKETMDLAQYYGLTGETQAAIVLGDEVLEEKAVLSGDEYYLPLAFVQENLNSRFYYAESEALLLYTTPLALYQMPAGSSQYTIAGQEQQSDKIIWILEDGEPYISLTFLHDFANFSGTVYQNPDRVQLYLTDTPYTCATIKKNTAVRYQGGVKSDILEQVEKGDTVYVLEEMETWTKVKTADSVIGYVENKRLAEDGDETVSIPTDYEAPVYTSIQKDYRINLAWHQVTNADANSGVDALLEQTKGVTTISPTWFFLSDNNGGFTSIADQSYVDDMHARGIEVWALIDNFTNDVDIAQILSTTSNRQALIAQLVNTVLSYGIDGINVDFEQIPSEAGEEYVQFLRELSIPCRQNGIVLSVDNYVPTGYTAHYNRKEQGEVIDYFIIMGYDEHYSGSAEAGSVASISYVREGIENTLADVPAEKVINGIPFYTRMWTLTDQVSSEALSMTATENYLAQYQVTAQWDDETCQNYASFEADGAVYQIWLEDTESIRAKLSVMAAHNLAGVAEWKLGLEKAQVWDVIEEYCTGQMDSALDGGDTQDSGALEEIITD